MGTDREHNFQPLTGAAAPGKAAERLLSSLGVRGGLEVSPLTGGANNRTYKVSAGGRNYLLKHYFRHAADKRNRLDAEFDFCGFAHAGSVRCVPRPLARDRRARVALYEYVEGAKIRPDGVTPALVRQALDFFRALNRPGNNGAAAGLPEASEACFSLARHLKLIAGRVRRLAAADDPSPAGRRAAAFVKKELVPLWEAVAREILARAEKLGLDPEKELSPEERRISPSDFGFHNAILTPGGRVKFIDFEYAGWDDPAKTVNDFFCQPAVPVPMDYYPGFLKTVVRGMKSGGTHALRAPVLFPAYRVKWCCILLNCFLPAGAERRSFANGPATQAGQKGLQLKKAERLARGIAAGLRAGNLFPG